MKKIIKRLLFIFLVGTLIVGCEKESSSYFTSSDTELVSTVKNKTTNEKAKKKIVFVARHMPKPGKTCLGSSKCSSCTCALGVCYCKKLKLRSSVASLDYDDSTADMEININNSTVTLIFDEETAYDGGIIEIQGDLEVEQEVADEFDVSDITLLEGTYTVDFSTNTYGEVIIDADIIE